jgi:hypothetical protein
MNSFIVKMTQPIYFSARTKIAVIDLVNLKKVREHHRRAHQILVIGAPAGLKKLGRNNLTGIRKKLPGLVTAQRSS